MQILQPMQNLLRVLSDNLMNKCIEPKQLLSDQLTEVREEARQLILTASGNAPSLPRSDWIDPPGTNSSRIFSESSSRTVPIYRCSNHPDRSNKHRN
jgi:hypothetical protein